MDNQSLHILHIEDDKFQHAYIKSMLMRGHIAVDSLYWAQTLKSGHDILKNHPIDVVLLDLMLPDSREMDTFLSIRTSASNLPVIIMSGLSDARLAQEAVKHGAQDFLVKGKVDEYTLIRSIQYAIERKKSEVTLNESQKRYQTLFESSTDAIFIATETTIFDCNHASVFMFKVNSKLDLIDINPTELSPELQPNGENSAEAVKRKTMEAIVHGSCYFEWLFKRFDDTTFFADVVLTAFTFDDTQLLQARIHDITTRKKALQALEESEARLKSLFNTIQTGIVIIDSESFIVESLNPVASQLIGKNQTEIIGQVCHDIICSGIESECPSSGPNISFYNVESVLSAKNGKIIPILKSSVPIEIDGKLKILLTFLDISEIKAAQDAVKNKERQLQEVNTQLTATLQQLKQTQASLIQNEKLASIGQLAAGVAHELNNPLGFVTNNFTALKNYAKVISQYLASVQNFFDQCSHGTSEISSDIIKEMQVLRKQKKIDFIFNDMNDLLDESTTGFERIISIVQGLRDFSRVDNDGNRENHDLNKALQDTLMVARNEIKYVADVSTEFGDIPSVMCNGGEINQVILNILVNAAQAISEQKRQEPGHIQIKTYLDPPFVVIEIRDDGPGIPDKIRHKIFDPFFTTKEVGKGTGLGLNISYDIVVNRHQGELNVESTPGVGTTFIIKLPIEPNRNSKQREN
ncbi:PAS domain S-box protein [candidate division KSB1 bacterium]|nr:PAS domain S-box protein [candidate division KSB1 bacterium]